MTNMRDGSNDEGIEGKLDLPKIFKSKVGIVDTLGNTTYSIIVGALLDYNSGLNLLGIIAARATGTGMNIFTGGPYGWWREKAFLITNTKEELRSIIGSTKKAMNDYSTNGISVFKESGKVLLNKSRKTLVDLLAFNTFQVPIYGVAVAIGSWISEGEVNMDKVQTGATYLATISPLIGPTMGWYMDKFRKVFGVESAAEGTYKNK